MLENFQIHQEGLISRVPRLARSVTMHEFAKYNGDIQECLRGIQKERLGGEAAAIDKTTRKRKWVESQESEGKVGASSTTHEETSKGTKSGGFLAIFGIGHIFNFVLPPSAHDAHDYSKEKGRCPSNSRCRTTSPSPIDKNTRNCEFY